MPESTAGGGPSAVSTEYALNAFSMSRGRGRRAKVAFSSLTSDIVCR